jgi:hypothetical protein
LFNDVRVLLRGASWLLLLLLCEACFDVDLLGHGALHGLRAYFNVVLFSYVFLSDWIIPILSNCVAILNQNNGAFVTANRFLSIQATCIKTTRHGFKVMWSHFRPREQVKHPLDSLTPAAEVHLGSGPPVV